MMLQDGMVLYHGSYTKVEEINLKMCSEGKDFGKGFYLTSSLDQAINFISTSLIKAKTVGKIPLEQNYGYVSSYRVHLIKDLKIYEFRDCSKEWLWFISQNRRKELSKALIAFIDKKLFASEVIIGKVANDTTNPVITAYLNGIYGDITSDRAINFAIEELMPNRLHNQFCFLTERAINCLEFVEAKKYDVR